MVKEMDKLSMIVKRIPRRFQKPFFIRLKKALKEIGLIPFGYLDGEFDDYYSATDYLFVPTEYNPKKLARKLGFPYGITGFHGNGGELQSELRRRNLKAIYYHAVFHYPKFARADYRDTFYEWTYVIPFNECVDKEDIEDLITKEKERIDRIKEAREK